MAQYFARRPFGYGRLGNLDRGQVVELQGAPNDEKLIRLGYLMEHSGRDVSACGECGAEFIGDAERAAHGKDRHRERPLTPAEEDAQIERKERMLSQVAPLFYENTKASQESGQAPAPAVQTPVAKPVQTAAVARQRAPRAKREPVAQ